MKPKQGIDYPAPANGWIVICAKLAQFAIAGSLDELATYVGTLQDAADRANIKDDDAVRCYELGRRLAIEVEPAICRIQPMEER